MEITASKLKTITTDETNICLMKSLFEAVAYTEVIRSIIEPLQLEIIELYKFKERAERKGSSAQVQQPITHPKHMYKASDEDFNLYIKELNEGYKRVNCLPKKDGCCPLLEAEEMVRIIKREIANHFEPQIGISYNQLSRNLSAYKMYFDLLMALFAKEITTN